VTQAGCAQAQPAAAAAQVGVLDKPCAVLPAAPPEVEAYLAAAAKARAAHQPAPTPPASGLAAYNDWQDRRALQDYAGLCRYHDQNATLPPATDHRVVFFGDSITELWGAVDPGMFAHDTLNRGISGQTTIQMIGRFQEDVIALHPRVVHILAGTNDIAGNTGPTTLPWIEANIRTMVETAKANHVRVVLASVLPAARYNWRASIEPVPQIQALNAWLQAYAKTEHLTFVDYRPPLDDGRHGFKPQLSADGVHPNAAGYAAMRPLAERAVQAALR
jgi:lysophospholipase L1-like esterase